MDESNARRIRILIVDDDQDLAGIFKDIIAAEGRLIDVCYDGLAAIEHIQNHGYDIILADLVMPKVGGIDILKFAKKINPDVVVIIITGYASLETALTAIKEGAYDYIRKPCKMEEMQVVVDNAVDKINLNRENRELFGKLQAAYHDMMIASKAECEDRKPERVHFFPANMQSLHYLYNEKSFSDDVLKKLTALSSLKEKGTLSESEFNVFKRHLLKRVDAGE